MPLVNFKGIQARKHSGRSCVASSDGALVKAGSYLYNRCFSFRVHYNWIHVDFLGPAGPRYKHGKKRVRHKLGIKRNRQDQPFVKGVASAWTSKVRQHWRRLHRVTRQEGLWNWSSVAGVINECQVGMMTGTLPCERLWASMLEMMPSASRCMSERFFKLISQIIFVRHNLRHYSGGYLPPWAREDSLLAQRLEHIAMTARALAESGTVADLIFEPFQKDFEESS